MCKMRKNKREFHRNYENLTPWHNKYCTLRVQNLCKPIKS